MGLLELIAPAQEAYYLITRDKEEILITTVLDLLNTSGLTSKERERGKLGKLYCGGWIVMIGDLLVVRSAILFF